MRTHVTHFESFTMIQNEYNQVKGELSLNQSYEEIDRGLMDNNEMVMDNSDRNNIGYERVI